MPVFSFRSRWRQAVRGLGLELAGLCCGLGALTAGCVSPDTNVLQGENGPITLEAINRILNDADLDEAETRQALRDLGITDEQLIDVLMQDL